MKTKLTVELDLEIGDSEAKGMTKPRIAAISQAVVSSLTDSNVHSLSDGREVRIMKVKPRHTGLITAPKIT